MTTLKNLRPYPAYKPSGVEWLGDVPEHWEVRRLKYWVGINDAELPETTSPEFAFRYLEIGAVGTGFLKEEPTPMRFAHAPSRARRILRSGDTIVSTVRTYLKAVWFAEDVEDALICSTGFVVLTPGPGTAPKFVSYSVQSNGFIDRLTAGSVGIAYPAVAESRFRSFHVCVPPLTEQTAIVRYLDYVDRRIRRYIQAKERLITLLKEKRQAAVSQAVTRGLDPSVSLKPSGVEWLGNVPTHWEVAALKRVAELNPGKTEAQSSLAADTLVTFLPMAQVGTDGAIDGQMLSASLVWTGFTYFRRNDVLVAKITPCFENGKGACLDSLPTEIGFGSTEFHVLRAKSSVSPQFLYHTTNLVDFRRLGASAMTGAAGQQRVPLEFVANHPLAVPPLPEQNAIVAYLGKAITDIDTAIARTRRQIDLLHEYRTRLIGDLVTGKIDVRKVMSLMQEQLADREVESTSADHEKGSL